MACRTAARPAEPQRHGFALRPPGASKDRRPCSVSPSMSARESTSAPQSGHTAGNGSRTSTANWVIQPRHSPATVSRRSGDAAGRCAPSRRALNSPPPPDARPRPRSCPPPTPASRASGPPRSARFGRGPADPANAHGPESARAAARTPPSSARIPRDLEERLSPRLAPASYGRRAGAYGSRHRAPGGRVDNGGTNRPGWG